MNLPSVFGLHTFCAFLPHRMVQEEGKVVWAITGPNPVTYHHARTDGGGGGGWGV